MKTDNATPAHLRHQTKFSRDGEINYTNRKPFRPKHDKERAKATARRNLIDGAYRSLVPVSFHHGR